MALSNERLQEAVNELLSRPGHEKVRSILYDLLVNGLEVPSTEIDFERPMPEVHGRADALLGNTVLEFKRDLRREKEDAEEELGRYLAEREAQTQREFLGIATDGTRFLTYQLREGALEPIGEPFVPSLDAPRRLLGWLDTALAIRGELDPTPEAIREEMGRQSLSYGRARPALAELWGSVATQPDVRLKRELWADLLQRVYGSRIDEDELWWQHTYLTVVAKAMAVQVLGIELPDAPDLLAGRPFTDVGINGAVESDFFDWVLAADGGAELVTRIARQVGRFRLREVQHDVLKVLYESLIDPEQRHDLGEFYTPDWLADLICEEAIAQPLEMRVLDPACGSGTFLFFAVRRLLAAADEAGLSSREALTLTTNRILGIDIHPVAVLVARVTYLLALGTDRLRRDRAEIAIPVYLGDALQWNTQAFLAEREVLIQVPDGGPTLLFPFAVTRDPALFDRVIDQILSMSERQADPAALAAWLRREGIGGDDDVRALTQTYQFLRRLHAEERNHIWGYVARNLSRPIWLSSEDQRVDVVIGNPPWLSYRFMTDEFQERFRAQCEERGLWAGGRLATHQDLSGLFFARAVELYLKAEGRIAFVMPHAALTRQQFAGFRTGNYRRRGGNKRRPADPIARVAFEQVWSLDERVQPLFPVPASVVFAHDTTVPHPMPSEVKAFAGDLPRRDASRSEAEQYLTMDEESIGQTDTDHEASSYHSRFRAGTTIFPQLFWLVTPVRVGTLGENPATPLVESRRSNLEKLPWRGLPSLRRAVEAQFLHRLYMGSSLAPYRLLEPLPALIPWDFGESRVLNADAAARAGFPRVAAWLGEAERQWAAHSRGNMTLSDRIDYHGALGVQMTGHPLRVIYAASGTLPAAAILRDAAAVVEHKLYWAAVASEEEARYLEAILNSEAARALVAHLQSRGQWGARDFDKVMLSLPIPDFDSGNALHQRLAEAAARAETVAAPTDISGVGFVRARQLIRQALVAGGVASEIDELVRKLLEAAGGA